jgi:hypothetical protein
MGVHVVAALIGRQTVVVNCVFLRVCPFLFMLKTGENLTAGIY